MTPKENYSRPTSYEEACAMNGTEPMNETALLQLGITPGQIAGLKLEEISKALNQGKPIDIYNGEDRWLPVFSCNDSPSAFEFCNSLCALSTADAGSGSRLALHEKADSNYTATQFIDLWKVYLSESK